MSNQTTHLMQQFDIALAVLRTEGYPYLAQDLMQLRVLLGSIYPTNPAGADPLPMAWVDGQGVKPEVALALPAQTPEASTESPQPEKHSGFWQQL